MSDPKLYTVGWICAISTEYVAAQAFLDEVHDGPAFVSPHDNNDYALGKFGNHNVVIAVLPDGEYGTNSAAGVARDMLHSFPNVRFGLMVGIGGGVANKHDIRLGDVVVSAPRDGNGGVFQYDFGKSIQDRSFRITGYLNQPPTILRTAVSGLRSRYEIEGHEIIQNVDSVLEKRPRLKRKYKKPDPTNDRLYRYDHIHVSGNDDNCVSRCGNDSADLIPRSIRGEDEDDPAIHYGIIASANQLIEDAILRDKLATDKDVLCFEMEAAGLMNHFPCLVIRGICDYADSHKNKAWQGYAAMTAAAYAKDLLCRIPPTQVVAEKKIVDLLSDVLQSAKKTEAGVETIRHRLDIREDLKIIEWLTPIDYQPIHDEILRKRQLGTGQWFLDSSEYQNWRANNERVLFCPGIPGAGKTVLAAIVVDDLISRFFEDETVGIAYIYCDFRRQDDQNVHRLLSSLLKQFSQQLRGLPREVRVLHDSHMAQNTRPSVEELMTTVQSVISVYTQVFVVVDALDECSMSDNSSPRFVSHLFQLQSRLRCGINILATSRQLPDISDQFRDRVQLEIRARRDDVLAYLKNNTSPQRFFLRKNESLQEKIRVAIAEAADGMFLLARLHFESLMAKMTECDVEDALKKLPTGSDAYNQAYDSAMDRIEAQGSDAMSFAKQVLLWTTFAYRPLTTRELRNALSVKFGLSKLHGRCEPEIYDLISICAGLVTIEEQTDTVRLVHYTAQQYIEQAEHGWLHDAHAQLATLCTTYISRIDVNRTLCLTVLDLRRLSIYYPLWHYTANHWSYHTRKCLDLPEAVVNFLNQPAKVDIALLAMEDFAKISGPDTYPRRKVNQRISNVYRFDRDWTCRSLECLSEVTGLHLAIYGNLEAAVKALLRQNNLLDLPDSEGRTPLYWAARHGRANLVELLLDSGHDPFRAAKNSHTAFSVAARRGHAIVLEMVRAHTSTDPDQVTRSITRQFHGRTLLSVAAEQGHDTTVDWLLRQSSTNINSAETLGRCSRRGYTPLAYAAKSGHVSVVKLLLSHPEIQPEIVTHLSKVECPPLPTHEPEKVDRARTPLSHAAEKGHWEVVEYLLQLTNVDPDSACNKGRTPLSYAAGEGHLRVVKILLEASRVDSTSRGSHRCATISDTAEKVCKELLQPPIRQKGVDPDHRCKIGRTPLSYAARSAHEDVVELLLGTPGVDPDSRCLSGRTPLSFAAQSGKIGVIKLLLSQKSVNPNSLDDFGHTPLSYADIHVSTDTALTQLLLDNGAEPLKEGHQHSKQDTDDDSLPSLRPSPSTSSMSSSD